MDSFFGTRYSFLVGQLARSSSDWKSNWFAFVGWWQRLSKNWYLHDICRSLGKAERLPETLAGIHQMGYTAPRPQGGNEAAISCFLPAWSICFDFHQQLGFFARIWDIRQELVSRFDRLLAIGLVVDREANMTPGGSCAGQPRQGR